jgi:hypothetical protein
LADLQKMTPALAGDAPLKRTLEQLLSAGEVVALHRRLRILLDSGCFPEPGPGRVVPWPLI